MLIRVLPEKLADANRWFHDVLNPEATSDNFDQPLIDETTGQIVAYWASVNLTPEQEVLVNERFFAHDSIEATKDMGTTEVTAEPVAISTATKSGGVIAEPVDVTPEEVPVRLGLTFEAMDKETVLETLKVRPATEADLRATEEEFPTDIKPIEITTKVVTK